MEYFTKAEFQTKKWRLEQPWYNTGKSNDCELYQLDNLKRYLKTSINKTNLRLNIRTYELKEVLKPMVKDDGFDWTENFDGILKRDFYTLLFNLKFVCDSGGSQTRTLREVYHFLNIQLEYLLLNPESNIYFINILEGDTSHKNMDKYIFLINLNKYKDIKNKIFIGDFIEFMSWYKRSLDSKMKVNYEIVVSEYPEFDRKIKLGLCCINNELREKGIFCSRTMTRNNFTVEKAKELALKNIEDIYPIVKYNDYHRIIVLMYFVCLQICFRILQTQIQKNMICLLQKMH